VTSAPTDTELLSRAAAGDHEAFSEVMRIHQDRVFSVCLRIMGSRDRALDAVQDTFLTVFRKSGQFKGEAAVGTWIYRIAVNTCYDHLRKAKRRPADPMPDYYDPPDDSAEDEVDSAGIRPDIHHALQKIPEEFRAAVVLSDMEGMSLPEVAEVLGVPVGTVKSRVFRGRRQLARLLGNRNP
jgi:RNA polymerase sigma-70 factor (ECF subfamily)